MQRDERQLLADAQAAEHSGAFAVVLECIPADVAQRITAAVKIPTIGIGAGAGCDGQQGHQRDCALGVEKTRHFRAPFTTCWVRSSYTLLARRT